MARFKRREISGGWALEQYGEHRHSYILITPPCPSIESVQRKLSYLPGSTKFCIANSIYHGMEIYFRCDLDFKKTLIKVAELLELPYSPPKYKRMGRKKVPVKQYTSGGEYIRTWDSALTASRELGINAGCIRNCAAGRQLHAGKFIWKKA